MRKLLVAIIAIAIFGCQNPSEDSYVLTGSVDSKQEGMAYLRDRVSGLMVDVDSARIENGQFVMEGKINAPELLYIQIDGVPGRIGVFVENTPIDLKIESLEPLEYTVSGSKSHAILDGLDNAVAIFDEKLRLLEEEITVAEKEDNTQVVNMKREEYETVENERRNEIKKYISQNPDMPVSVYIATRQLSHGADAEEMRNIFSLFDTSLSGTRYYDAMAGNVETMERVAPGKPAVDFTLENTKGEKVSLSDFRGKVVLISFWASWCPYCRVENPNLVKVYEEFGGEKFTVLGVSLDRNKDAWLKGIEEDGLEWQHVSDLEGWRSGPAGLYAIRSIPQNVLIGPDGIIIERNVKYHDLGEKLQKLFLEI
jgi:peroxiredoxin